MPVSKLSFDEALEKLALEGFVAMASVRTKALDRKVWAVPRAGAHEICRTKAEAIKAADKAGVPVSAIEHKPFGHLL